MESNDKLKEIDIKNHTCHYFENIININDLNLDILIGQKLYYILIYNVACKTQYSTKPLHIIFDKVHVRKYDGTEYLALFHSDEKYEKLFNKIRYLTMVKTNIPNVYSHIHIKIKINSGDDLPFKKSLTMENVVTLIKFVFNKNHNHYHYEMILEKCSYNI